MPYVAPEDAHNQPALDLDTVVPVMGEANASGVPGRTRLIGTDSARWVLLHWPPGYVTTPHYHPRAEEAFYILRGRAIFRFGDEAEPREVGPGTLLLARRNQRHTIGVPGPEPLLFIASVTPNEDAPDETIDEPGAPGVTL